MFIKKGNSGTSVYKIQYRLGDTPNGVFGDVTEELVKKFQKENNLIQDGIVGPNTWERIFGATVNEFTPVGVVVHSMTERISWEGKEISARELLNKLGLSVHALIHPNGRIEHITPFTEKAAHAGKSEHSGLSGLNSFFLGFELLVSGNNDYSSFVKRIQRDDCYTEAQFKAAVDLTKSWMVRYNMNVHDIVRHSDVSGDSVRGRGRGKVDPGNGFDWERFLSEIA